MFKDLTKEEMKLVDGGGWFEMGIGAIGAAWCGFAAAVTYLFSETAYNACDRAFKACDDYVKRNSN